MATSNKVSPPFRADHVGSFLRPQHLIQARANAGLTDYNQVPQEDRISREELRRIEDEAIIELIKFQEDVGLHAITDGEFRRASWAYDTPGKIEGMVLKRQDESKPGFQFSSGSRPPMAYTEGKLGRKPGGIAVSDFKFVKQHTSRTPKVTMPTPSMFYIRFGRDAVSEEAYPDIEDFLEDLMQVYRDEVAELAAEGCTYLQIDNTDTAILCDPRFQEMARQRGQDPLDQLDLQARLVSGAVGGRPDNMTVSMHLCRGNSAGNWMAQGGYEYVAERLFNKFDVDAFFLEYDDERSGDFEPLRFVPTDKTVILGLVTTKTPENEDRDTLLRRIEQAAKFVPLQNLGLSPQCGFASVAKGNPITLDDQRRKLELIVGIADEVWGGQ